MNNEEANREKEGGKASGGNEERKAESTVQEAGPSVEEGPERRMSRVRPTRSSWMTATEKEKKRQNSPNAEVEMVHQRDETDSEEEIITLEEYRVTPDIIFCLSDDTSSEDEEIIIMAVVEREASSRPGIGGEVKKGINK